MTVGDITSGLVWALEGLSRVNCLKREQASARKDPNLRPCHHPGCLTCMSSPRLASPQIRPSQTECTGESPSAALPSPLPSWGPQQGSHPWHLWPLTLHNCALLLLPPEYSDFCSPRSHPPPLSSPLCGLCNSPLMTFPSPCVLHSVTRVLLQNGHLTPTLPRFKPSCASNPQPHCLPGLHRRGWRRFRKKSPPQPRSYRDFYLQGKV